MKNRKDKFFHGRRWQNGQSGGFTLIELLIVVVILGILGAIALPKFSDAYSSASGSTLKDELRSMRTQSMLYKAQHRDVAPGYPPGNPGGAPNQADFVAQMTAKSSEQGGVGTNFGPYLSRIPSNPINKLDTITIVPNGSVMPAPDNTTGWIYKPETLEVLPNLTGVDVDGVAYGSY